MNKFHKLLTWRCRVSIARAQWDVVVPDSLLKMTGMYGRRLIAENADIIRNTISDAVSLGVTHGMLGQD